MPGFLGALPSAAFAMMPRNGASPWAIDEGGAMDTPEPFIWGQGGSRMTAEDIARERQMAQRQIQAGADYSPIASPWQGLARVAQGITGGLQMRNARRAGETNAAEGDAITQALLAGGGSGGAAGDPVLAALLNPNTPEPVRALAQMQYKQAHPTPQQPTEFERELAASGVMAGTPEFAAAMKQRVNLKTDPETVVTLPGGGIFIGPRSELSNALTGGGGPTSASSGASTPPAILPPDFDAFDKGGPASKAPATFR